MLGLSLAIWGCSCLLAILVASGKGRAGSGFVLGLLLGPLGAIAAFALAPSPEMKEREFRERLVAEARIRAELGLPGRGPLVRTPRTLRQTTSESDVRQERRGRSYS